LKTKAKSQSKAKATPEVAPEVARKFIYGEDQVVSDIEPVKPEAVRRVTAVSRSPISTRIRTEFTTAFKRASLERQLHGEEPNTLMDILEEAIEAWLKSNGYHGDRSP
jgi:hypothetical protein